VKSRKIDGDRSVVSLNSCTKYIVKLSTLSTSVTVCLPSTEQQPNITPALDKLVVVIKKVK